MRRTGGGRGCLGLADEFVVFAAGKVAACLQRLFQPDAGAVQPHLRIASTYPEGLSDFIVGQSAELTKHEHGSIGIRQLCNDSADAIVHFLADDLLFRTSPGIGRGQHCLVCHVVRHVGKPDRDPGLVR